MTPQEQQMIDGLISRVRSTPVQDKDSEAEQHIQQGLGSNPDSLYILVQTVLVQQYGLEQAKNQITELKQQLETQSNQTQSKGSGGSFLSHIFGGGSSNSQPTEPPAQQGYQPVNNPGYGSQGYPGGGYPPPPPPPAYPNQGYPNQGYPAQGGGGLFGGGAGGGGFMRGALQTAAGVAAGAAVFEGMEGLFHGFGGGGRERGFGGGETIVNNYYDDDRGDRGDSGSGGDRGFYNPDDDASRTDLSSSDAGSIDQGGSDIGSFGGDSFTDSGSDTSSFDDSSSFDDGSSDFSDNS